MVFIILIVSNAIEKWIGQRVNVDESTKEMQQVIGHFAELVVTAHFHQGQEVVGQE